jgi:anti-sigma-K factor RskA
LAEMNGHVDLGSYVLDRLGADERPRFEAHLATCDECRGELGELERVARLLEHAAPADEPPVGLERRVFAAVERAAVDAERTSSPRRRPRRRRSTRSIAFAGAAAAATAALVLALRGGDPAGPLEVATTLAAPAGGQARASVEVRKTGIGRVVDLRSDSLPILPKGDYYELWFAGPGDTPGRPNRISAGTFHPDENGRSHVRFAAAVDPGLYPVLIVTAEPGDGDPRPTGPEVLRSRR